MKVNLNDIVKVRLTDKGVRVLKIRHQELNDFLMARGGNELSKFNLSLDDEGYYTTQLWTLLKDFKGYFEMTAPMVFKDNDLIFKEDSNE